MSGTNRLDRPHIEFVQQQALPWVEETEGFWAGHAVKALSWASDGSGTSLVRFAGDREFTLELSPEMTIQMLVLDGVLEVDCRAVHELGYVRIDADMPRPTLRSRGGASAIVFVDNALSTARSPEVVVTDSSTIEWRSETDGHFALGAVRKDLCIDPVTGEELFLMGTLPLRWNTRAQVHPVVEEVFVLSGELIGPNGVMTAGAYFWRPAEVWHGPFGQRAGALMLIRSPGGALTKEYRDIDEEVARGGGYLPILPEYLSQSGDASSTHAAVAPWGAVAKADEVAPR